MNDNHLVFLEGAIPLPVFVKTCAQTENLKKIIEVLVTLVECRMVCAKYGMPFAAGKS